MTDHELLVATRNYIAEHRWIKKALQIGDGVCMVGGIRQATCPTTTINLDHSVFDVIVSVLPVDKIDNSLINRRGWLGEIKNVHRVTAWNDYFARDKEDVLRILDEAIALSAPDPDVSFLEVAEKRELAAA